ncbi:hypothetical protein BDR26DRAFT_977234 [Obelidium mucronatum]|nr:hypothetical protein BDR26DRAFT_977234 [Obelidium mucronatum]
MSFIDEARAVVVLANELQKVKPFLHRFKTAVKLYDNNNRMRAICDHISKQFSLTNETVFTLADKVFQCPGMDAVNHWKPVQPSVLVAPFSQCHRCTKNLTFSSTQVVVLGMEGPYHASLFKGNCTKCRMWYNVDSVAYMSEDKQKQLIEMYPLETIMSVGFLKINEQYYVTIPFADLWLKHLPSGLLVKLYREQHTYSLAFPTIKVPDPDSAVIFKRGFYVYHMLLLQQYISKIAANDDYEHMRYTHFRPSWAPKTTHLWNKSLFLGPYLPKTGDSIHDIRPAMREYVTFMTDKKWQHRCNGCHQFYNGKEISGSVMDGKVMGHLLCSVPGCVLPILGVNTLFCSSHAQLRNECIISGCKRKKTDTVLHTCGLSAHNATVQEIIGKQWNKDFKATRKSKKTRTSTVHIDTQEKELVADQRFKYSLKQRFLPGIFMAVWSCGMIIGISKMYSFESSTFISRFLCHCFARMGEVPTFVFYDRACRLLQSLRARHVAGKFTIYESVLFLYLPPIFVGIRFLYKTVTFVVDRFHFRMHRDDFCTEHCDPAKFKELTSGGPANGKGRFNTSAAEHCAKWFDQTAHLIRFHEPVQADFIMWCLADLRNADIQSGISKKKRVIRNESEDKMEAEEEQQEKDDEEDDEDTNEDDGEGVKG